MKAIFNITIALMLAISLGFASPHTAEASQREKRVTIKVGDHNCRLNGRYHGRVSAVLLDVVPGNNPAARWVGGNSVQRNVYYKSAGSRVSIIAKIHCKTWWGDPGYYRDVYAGRWVTSNDHTSNWLV